MNAAEVLALHVICGCGEWAENSTEQAQHQLDALKAAGYAVVKLPKSGGIDDDGQEWFGDGDIRVDHTARQSEYPSIYLGSRPFEPHELRLEAADMLAAADAAEVSS